MNTATTLKGSDGKRTVRVAALFLSFLKLIRQDLSVFLFQLAVLTYSTIEFSNALHKLRSRTWKRS